MCSGAGYIWGMRKTTTLLTHALPVVLMLGAPAAKAQFITLMDDWGNTVNSSVINVWIAQDPAPAHEVDVHCQLNNASNTVVNMTRYELSYPSTETINYYCWGECYAPAQSGTHPEWPAPMTNTLHANEFFEGFHGYYAPNGVPGQACFRYVWFDDNNPTDSVWVDICWNATPVGVVERTGDSFAFNAYPVPSNGGNVELTFDAPRPNERMVVELHDALGQLISSQVVRTGQQRMVLGEQTSASGLVFATLRVDGRAVATRRLVLGGH